MSSTLDSNQGIILDAVSWILFFFTLIVCCMRLYADFFILRSPRLDTYITSFTFLVATTSQVFTTLSVYHGMGQHLKSLDPVQVMYSLKWSWMAQILQLFANTTGKVAVITYLTTIHGPYHARAKLAYLWTLGSLQIASIIILIVLILAQCSPVPKLWNEAVPGTCNGRIRNQNFAFFQGGLSAFTDICLAVYPMVLFWDLQIKPAKKVLLCVLFGSGLLAATSSIVKTSNLHRVGNTTDITYALAYLITWNAADMYIVFIAGSIPTLSPFFKRYFSKAAKSNNHYRNRGNMPINGDDGTTLTSAPVLPGRAKAYTGAMGRMTVSQIDDDDSAEESWTGNGQIVLKTNVDIRRDEEFEGIAQ